MSNSYIQMPEHINKDEATFSDTYGRFYIQPLERGYGVTLGNSLRRVLLSSLHGTAIIAIRINDAQHEFTTIKGVVEDLSEIILNLKEIRFKDLTGKSNKIEFKLKGPYTFTAKDIQNNTADFKILNPDKHIATLNKDANLDIELRIGQGIGYVPSDENKNTSLPLGFIPVDSLFSPVTKVSYLVENTRVGKITDFEKLVLDVNTDGSINPEEALTSAARILQDLLTMVSNLNPKLEVKEIVKKEE